MADTAIFSPSRRFVIAAFGIGAAGLAVGCTVGGSEAAGPVTLSQLGDYVRVGTDNTITVYLRHIEFGQGVSTGLTTIVAEEIDADWGQMLAATALLTATPKPSEQQITDGMTSNICRCATYHRIRGAVARASEIMG